MISLSKMVRDFSNRYFEKTNHEKGPTRSSETVVPTSQNRGLQFHRRSETNPKEMITTPDF